MSKLRVIRILIYEGEEGWVRDTLRQSYVKREFRPAGGHGTIREGIIGELGEQIPTDEYLDED